MLIYAKDPTIYIPKHLTIDNCEVVEKDGEKNNNRKVQKPLHLEALRCCFQTLNFPSFLFCRCLYSNSWLEMRKSTIKEIKKNRHISNNWGPLLLVSKYEQICKQWKCKNRLLAFVAWLATSVQDTIFWSESEFHLLISYQ